MKNIFTFTCIILFLVGKTANAQAPVSFINGNLKFSNPSFHSGVAVSVVMDGDGMDDIAHMDQGYNLYYDIQRTDSTFRRLHVVSTGTGFNSAWSMVVGDVDNNGKRDVAVGFYGSAQLIRSDSTLTNFTTTTLPSSNFFLQNMNFADINNDGWIDIWGCNDDATSIMWGNDSTGHYPGTTNFFSPATTPASDNSGNYGSIWTDVNNDGNIDFFVAHCRQGVGDTADPRRRNQLFINDGVGGFHDDWQNTRGLRIAAESWTASFEDIDNDGDLDAVITCQDVPSKLFSNDGNGYFTDITAGSGFIVDVTPIESKMEDFDNDGFVDILVTGSDSRFYHNNHNNTFTMIPITFDSNHIESFAIGDLNHDGRIDVYATYSTIYTNPTSINDVLWLNNTNNGNHFVTFNLQGTVSSRDALGARVEIYGAWGKQIREVRAGESYGTSNSFMCHFGLGTAPAIDSVIVRWPSHLVTHLYNPAVDQFITIIEGQCSSPDNVITFIGPSVLCNGQSVTMNAAPGDRYLWSTGDTTSSITVSNAGEYNVKITAPGNACSSISKTVTIITHPDTVPTITAYGPTTFCEGDSVILLGSFAEGYSWSNGDTTQNTTVKQPGNYTLMTHGVCSNFTSQPVTISTVPSHISSVTPGAVCEGKSVTLSTNATGTIYWFDSLTGGNIVNVDTAYTIIPAATVTYYVESHDTLFGLSGSVGPVDTSIGAGIFYSGDEYEIFNVTQPMVLKSVKVFANSAKSRTIELRNAAGGVLQTIADSIPAGESIVNLNFIIGPANNYQLGWPIGSQPDLYRNSTGAHYPYTINGLISVTNNSISDTTFWYG